ncbi:MAG: pitrilysin family protein [Verrucomicrobiota bacterium]
MMTNNDEVPALPPGVQVVNLDNGLVLILREDHSAPVVSAQAWCKTGSIHEGRWLGAGLSHVLEHMLFKGTTTRGSGKIDQEVHDAGGYMNAYTSFDRTVYFIDVPNTGATVAIDILCDIMQHATLPEAELAKEMDVIRREMDMGQDDPNQRSGRRLFETAYTRSPYRFTVIGYPDIFNELKREDIFNYYREKYTPNNLFMVVVGDFKAEEVIAQVRAAFANTKARPMPPEVLPEEPRQLAEREVVEEAPVEMAHVHFSWHIPDVRHTDIPVLDVLATLLGSGRSSRLYQEVREKGLVVSADAWTYNPGNPGLFGMSAMIEADKYDSAKAALLSQVERFKNELPSEAELAKAVKQFIAGTLSARKTMAGQGQDLGGNWIAANDLNFSARYLETVKQITPSDLQRVARGYLTRDNRTIYALVPEGSKQRVALMADTATRTPVQSFVLANGMRLLLKEDHRLPFVEFRAVLRGGILSETAATNGISLLTAKLLLKGTKTRRADEIAREIESLGGSLDTFSANNTLGLSMEVMREDFSKGLELFADVILNPVFPAEAFEREREVQLASIRAQRDHLLQCAIKMMRRGLFGDTGYGYDALGTEAGLAQLTPAHAAKCWQDLGAPENCVLSIYGNFQTGEVCAEVEKALAAWQRKAHIPALQPSAALTEILRLDETRDKKQGVLVIGFRGTTMLDEDRFALELIQESCSDLGSRLFTRIREKLGLAYYVGAQNMLGLTPGFFAFYAGTEPDKISVCEAEMLREVATLCSEGLTDEELKRSKAKIIGQKKIGRQDLGHCATVAALDELYGLGYQNHETEDARYAAVTLEQIRHVAQKFLTPDRMVVAVIRPE